MPAKSKKQFKYLKAVEHGAIKKSGLSRKEAAEYTKGQKGKKYKSLPSKAKGKASSKKSSSKKKR